MRQPFPWSLSMHFPYSVSRGDDMGSEQCEQGLNRYHPAEPLQLPPISFCKRSRQSVGKNRGEVIHTMSLHRWMEHWRNISISISISQICSNTWCQRKHPFEPFLFVSCIHVARRILTGAWALDSARPHKPLGKTRGLKHPETTQQPWVEIIIMFSNPNLLANFRFWWMNTSEPLTLVKDGSSSTMWLAKRSPNKMLALVIPRKIEPKIYQLTTISTLNPNYCIATMGCFYRIGYSPILSTMTTT